MSERLTTDWERDAMHAIIDDLSDRSGVLDGIDDEVMDEIREAIHEIIVEHVPPALLRAAREAEVLRAEVKAWRDWEWGENDRTKGHKVFKYNRTQTLRLIEARAATDAAGAMGGGE